MAKTNTAIKNVVIDRLPNGDRIVQIYLKKKELLEPNTGIPNQYVIDFQKMITRGKMK